MSSEEGFLTGVKVCITGLYVMLMLKVWAFPAATDKLSKPYLQVASRVVCPVFSYFCSRACKYMWLSDKEVLGYEGWLIRWAQPALSAVLFVTLTRVVDELSAKKEAVEQVEETEKNNSI